MRTEVPTNEAVREMTPTEQGIEQFKMTTLLEIKSSAEVIRTVLDLVRPLLPPEVFTGAISALSEKDKVVHEALAAASAAGLAPITADFAALSVLAADLHGRMRLLREALVANTPPPTPAAKSSDRRV